MPTVNQQNIATIMHVKFVESLAHKQHTESQTAAYSFAESTKGPITRTTTMMKRGCNILIYYISTHT